MTGFNTIIPLENGKTVTAKWYTNECLSNVLKQVEKHRRLNDLIIHHDNASALVPCGVKNFDSET
jgi:hypothetical protein